MRQLTLFETQQFRDCFCPRLMNVKAITIHQPMATFLAIGLKKIETRTWEPTFRGTLIIHASGQKWKPEELHEIIDFLPLPYVEREYLMYEVRYPTGCIVATSTLEDCVWMDSDYINGQSSLERKLGYWREGNCAWILKDVLPTKEIACTGRQKLWNVPARCLEQLNLTAA